ncbi:MAG: O-antigen ligase family protein [Aggregatilineales bacterium]
MRRHTLERVLSLIPTIYLLLLGATWNGMLPPLHQQLTLGLLTITAVVWWGVRWRAGWSWHSTPLDALLVVWLGVFTVSIAANPETWRRSAEALWYMLLYMAVWHTIADALANGMERRVWLTAIAAVGAIQVPIALFQVVNFYAQGGTGFARPIGLTGNANFLGAFSVVFLTLAAAAFFEARGRLVRVIWGGYALVVLLMLFSTFSRGAWVGAVAALGTVGVLGLLQRGINSLQAARSAWYQLPNAQRRWAGLGIMLCGAAVIGLAVLTIDSLGISGRGTEWRTLLWQTGWEMFLRQPVTGAGLFTFGYHQAALVSIPPVEPQASPHNVALLILSEFGLIGFGAALVTALVLLAAARRQWTALSKHQRWPFIGAASALVGISVHHIFDTPIMLPAMTLTIIVLLAVVTIPYDAAALRPAWRQRLQTMAMAALWTGLLIVGAWQSSIMSQYTTILSDVVRGEDVGQAAAQLEQVMIQDPQNSAYRRQHAYLLGVAANWDEAYLERALAAYELLNRLEPFYSVGFVNHAALHWQAGNRERAAALAQQAVNIAPDWTLSRELLAFYQGQLDTPPERVESPYAAKTVHSQMLRYVIVEELLPQIERASP